MLNDILVNDIVNQLQTEKSRIPWKRCKSAQCYFSQERIEVIIGNDVYNVTALKSYNTVVGFVYNGIVYKCGVLNILRQLLSNLLVFCETV